MDLTRRFLRHLEESRLLDGATCVAVAWSGGGDSTALLLLLREWARESGVPLVAMHVLHGLRGRKGEQDAVFCARLAADLSLPFGFRAVDVPAHRRKGESLEAAARRLRYEALLALAAEIGERTLLATGHTLDDQAETVLLNLHRHAGRTRGGIRARREDGVVRPLLLFSRADLRAFLSRHGVPWREDETNENERLLRNRIRRQELPALEAAAPGTAGRLARAGEAWSRRLEALDREIDRVLAKGGIRPEGPWPRALVAGLGPDGAARLLVRAAGVRGGVPGRVQLSRVIARLLEGETRLAESLAGLRLSADSRVVRLTSRSPRP
ncbi:MAG: tRNA lysidine(34) synthetase TilS [Thermoanaerobaculia bacterium]